jgi:hypothetical protein
LWGNDETDGTPKNATAYYFIAWPLFQLNVKKISVEKKK